MRIHGLLNCFRILRFSPLLLCLKPIEMNGKHVCEIQNFCSQTFTTGLEVGSHDVVGFFWVNKTLNFFLYKLTRSPGLRLCVLHKLLMRSHCHSCNWMAIYGAKNVDRSSLLLMWCQRSTVKRENILKAIFYKNVDTETAATLLLEHSVEKPENSRSVILVVGFSRIRLK